MVKYFNFLFALFAFLSIQICAIEPISDEEKLLVDDTVEILLTGTLRAETMKYAMELMSQRQAQVIVETGTARGGHEPAEYLRGDGGSTLVFGNWAMKNDSMLYSVDISPEAVEAARYLLGSNQNVQCICQDSVQFLKDFNQQIDFLYLDSFDFDFDNPEPSQEHHLKEIIAAYSKLTSKSVVMIDDCSLPNGGKGKLVIEYLIDRDWVIVANIYQVILVHRSSL